MTMKLTFHYDVLTIECEFDDDDEGNGQASEEITRYKFRIPNLAAFFRVVKCDGVYHLERMEYKKVAECHVAK